MKQFRNHLGRLLLRLLLSEILCLILAVSFAMLGGAPLMQTAGMLCGIAAHLLLIGSAAQRAADHDLRLYRQTGIQTGTGMPLLLAFCAMLPGILLYLLLCILRDSVLIQNLFLLLNAPFIGIYKLLFAGNEPFSAVPHIQRLLTALPLLLTGIAVPAGYLPHYRRGAAAYDAGKFRT